MAHMQAYIWNQDLVLHPEFPDPCTHGWAQQEDCSFVPVLYCVPPSPKGLFYVDVDLVTVSDAAHSERTNLCVQRCAIVEQMKIAPT